MYVCASKSIVSWEQATRHSSFMPGPQETWFVSVRKTATYITTCKREETVSCLRAWRVNE